MVEYPRKGLWTIAFVSKRETGGEVEEKTGKQKISIYVPTTPNPTSGFLIFVDEKDVIKLDMSVEDGIKYVISCGIVTPNINEKRRKKCCSCKTTRTQRSLCFRTRRDRHLLKIFRSIDKNLNN